MGIWVDSDNGYVSGWLGYSSTDDALLDEVGLRRIPNRHR